MAGTGKDDNGASRRICLEPQIFLFFSVYFIYLLAFNYYLYKFIQLMTLLCQYFVNLNEIVCYLLKISELGMRLFYIQLIS